MVNISLKSLTSNTKLSMALTLVLAVLLTTSVATMVLAFKSPIYIKERLIKSTLSIRCRYNYTVRVRPSITYSNRTFIGMGTPLYFRLLKYMDLELVCNIESSKKIDDIAGRYFVDLAINSSAGWMYFIRLENGNITNQPIVIKIPVNITKLLGTIDSINKEIGVRGTIVIVNIKPLLKMVLSFNDGTKRYVALIPQFDLIISYDKGSIEVNGIGYHKVLRDEKIIKHVNNVSLAILPPIPVSTLRTASLFVAIASCTGLVINISRPWRKREISPKLIANKYSSMIIDGRLSEVGNTTAVIDVNNIKDLANLAESLGKPILHSVVNRVSGVVIHRYYVTDGSVVYRYTLTSS